MDETDSYASLGVGVGTVSLLFSVYFIILYIMSYPKKKCNVGRCSSLIDLALTTILFLLFFFSFLVSCCLGTYSTIQLVVKKCLFCRFNVAWAVLAIFGHMKHMV